MKKIPGLLATWVFGAAAAHAGSITDTVSRELPTGTQTAVTTLSVEGGRVRMEQKDSAGNPGDSGMIFKNDTIYALNHKNKSYTVIDRATVKSIAAKMNEEFKRTEERLAQMDPEQRAMVEQSLGRDGELGGSQTEYAQSARSDKAAGKSCRIWEGTRGGEKVIEYCVVPFASVAGGQDAVTGMKGMMALMKEMYDAISASGMGANPFTTEWDGVNAVDGYPVRVRIFDEGTPVSENLLQSSRSAAVAADQFEIPAGYVLEKMQGVQ